MEDENVDNVVFVGDKSFVRYIDAGKFQLNKFDKIIIRARGKFISRAIAVSHALQEDDNITSEDIIVSSEEFKRKEDDRIIKVSTIDIILVKKEVKKWRY